MLSGAEYRIEDPQCFPVNEAVVAGSFGSGSDWLDSAPGACRIHQPAQLEPKEHCGHPVAHPGPEALHWGPQGAVL